MKKPDSPRRLVPELCKYTLGVIELSKLRRDKEYSREVSMASVNRIVTEFLPTACGVLILSLRDGVLYILDGNHRCKALIILGIEKWPCLIYEGLSVAEEIAAWVQFQKSRPIPPNHLYKVKKLSGDEFVCSVDRVVESFGLSVCTGKASLVQCPPNVIPSASNVCHIAQSSGLDGLALTLRVVTTTWGEKERLRLSAALLSGVAGVISRKEWRDALHLGKLVEVLGRYSVDGILAELQLKYGTYHKNQAFLLWLRQAYNYKSRTRHLPELNIQPKTRA